MHNGEVEGLFEDRFEIEEIQSPLPTENSGSYAACQEGIKLIKTKRRIYKLLEP